MSPLAFDKQGKPFTFQRRTKRLLVRLFRNPSARGTCCQVLGGDGQALYVDPETDYVEFRRAVGQVPGLYRLDQCDEDGNELDEAQPAYVAIDVARNAQNADAGTNDVNPLVIIQQMAAIQADVMKTMAAQQAALIAATAEILRAPYRPAPIAAPASELRNADASSDEDDDHDDEIDEEPQPESTLISVARMVDATMPNMAAQLGEFLYEKIFELTNKRKKSASAVAMPAPVAAPTPTAAPHVAPPVVPMATVSATSQAHESVAHATAVPVPVPSPTSTSPEEQLETAALNATDIPTPSAPVPTPAQMAHLVAIRERLDDKERAIAEAAIRKMTPAQLAHWLGELSDQSVEDATTTIRDLIAQIRKAAVRSPQP
jgi:hypothetical protein